MAWLDEIQRSEGMFDRYSIHSPILLLAIVAAPILADENGAFQLRSRLRPSLEDERLFQAFIKRIEQSDVQSLRSFKSLVDAEGRKQLPGYLRSFKDEIDRASKVDPQSIVNNSSKLQERRQRILRLGELSWRIDKRLGNEKARLVTKVAKNQKLAPQGKPKEPTFQAYLTQREQGVINDWLKSRGFRQTTRLEAEILTRINQARASAQLQPLAMDPLLQMSAREHCRDMIRHSFFSHRSSVKGRETYQKRAARYGKVAHAENIANAQSPLLVLRMWWRSDGHRKNIMNPQFNVIGVGIAGKKYTTVFAYQPAKPSAKLPTKTDQQDR